VTYLLDSKWHSASLPLLLDNGVDDCVLESGRNKAITHDVEINECLPFLIFNFAIALNTDSSLV